MQTYTLKQCAPTGELGVSQSKGNQDQSLSHTGSRIDFILLWRQLHATSWYPPSSAYATGTVRKIRLMALTHMIPKSLGSQQNSNLLRIKINRSHTGSRIDRFLYLTLSYRFSSLRSSTWQTCKNMIYCTTLKSQKVGVLSSPLIQFSPSSQLRSFHNTSPSVIIHNMPHATNTQRPKPRPVPSAHLPTVRTAEGQRGR